MVKRILIALAAALVAAAVAGAGSDQPDGRALFLGRANCAACHGPGGRGTPMAPDLTDAEWLHGDGTREAVEAVIRAGVPRPVRHRGGMPPMGGARLGDAEIAALVTYVLSLSAGDGR
jgi:cytochrome c oxidase cbb3-type subunit III